jgi:XTP/dITP diphosphohydrolase
MIQKLVIASGNAGKLKEIQALLSPLQVDVLPQSAFNVTEASEPHMTFIENALAKARHASLATGLPALADDSGLCLEALEGAPGVHSAYFCGEAWQPFCALLLLLSAGAQTRRPATANC